MFGLDDGRHVVELEHGYWSGKRVIRVDGKLLEVSRKLLDTGSEHYFELNGHPGLIRIRIISGLIPEYELFLDGRLVAGVGEKYHSGENAEKYIDVSQKKIFSEDSIGLKSKPAYYPRAGFLIFGIIMLILGIVVYLYTQPAIVHYESLIGTIGRDIGSAFGYTRLEQEYQILKLLNIGSFIAMVIGVISVIIGLIGKRE